MSSFWAMSDPDKTLLVLKILLIGFGWALVIVGALVIMAFIMLLAQDFMIRLEERQEESGYSPQTDPQVTAFKIKQTRRRIRSEQDEFFRNVQELQNDLR